MLIITDPNQHPNGNTIRSLENYMMKTEAYRNKRLSVNDVAQDNKIPVKKLSELINKYYRLRFTDWVNNYRVNHVKNMLKTEAWTKLSLEGLAVEAGFASRSAFFASFKKLTGGTALTYLKQYDHSRFIE